MRLYLALALLAGVFAESSGKEEFLVSLSIKEGRVSSLLRKEEFLVSLYLTSK